MIQFRCYDPSGDGTGGIHQWLSGLIPSYRAQVISVLELLANEQALDDADEVKSLRGACEGLTEIIIDFLIADTEIHIRILGVEGPGRGEFTLLTGFEKTNTDSIYGFFCAQARQRWEGVQRDGSRAPRCEFP